MYCNYCGKVIQDDALLCAYCGVRVAASVSRKRLVRPEANKQIAGVCAGLAEFFDLDVTVVRVVALLTAIFTGCGFLAYVIGWIVIPLEPVRSYVPPVPNGSQQTAGS